MNFSKTPLNALHAYCDADWPGSWDDRHSTMGFVIFLSDNLLSWVAKKQTMRSRSMAEAKYRALATTMAELMWFLNLFKSLDYSISSQILYCDNLSAISMEKNPAFQHHTKHIEIDVHFVHEQIVRCIIYLEHILGSTQDADIFTKSLCAHKFIPNHAKLLIGCGPP